MSLQSRLASLITAIGADIKLLNLKSSSGLTDDFMSGNITSAQIGELGWGRTGGASSTYLAGVQNHPGIYQIITGTTLGTISAIHLNVTPTLGQYLGSELWDVTFIIRPTQVDTDTQIRVGVTSSAGSATPSDGAYFEKLYADTNWFRVTRAASVQFRGAMSIAVAAGWTKLRVRRIDASTIGFSVNGGAEQTSTTNLPSTAAIQPFVQITNQTVTSKSLDVDRFDQVIYGMTR